MKTLKTFSNLAEAGFAGSLLEAAGIPALLADEQSSLWSLGAVIPIRLQVGDGDLERARDVLESGFKANDETPGAALAALQPGPGDGGFPIGLFIASGVLFVLIVFAMQNAFEGRKARSGEEFTYEVDRNKDGRTDQWAVYGHDGQPKRGALDQNFDGRPDLWITYRDGVEESVEQDTDFNGTADMITSFTAGVAVRTELRPNKSETVLRTFLFRAGVLFEERVDEERDGKFDYKIVYDPFGNRSERMPLTEAK